MGSSLSGSVAPMAKLTRLFGYQTDEGEWVYPDEAAWDLTTWEQSESRGPWIRPSNDLVVFQQDPYPDKTGSGLIHFASDQAVDNVMHYATVLAVGPGKWNKKGTRREPPNVKPGDRIVTVRFVAYNRIADDCNARLRIAQEGEIWGFADSEAA